jgi:hypothetical protein
MNTVQIKYSKSKKSTIFGSSKTQCYIFQNKSILGRERVIGENTSSYSFNGYLTLMFVGPS